MNISIQKEEEKIEKILTNQNTDSYDNVRKEFLENMVKVIATELYNKDIGFKATRVPAGNNLPKELNDKIVMVSHFMSLHPDTRNFAIQRTFNHFQGKYPENFIKDIVRNLDDSTIIFYTLKHIRKELVDCCQKGSDICAKNSKVDDNSLGLLDKAMKDFHY